MVGGHPVSKLGYRLRHREGKGFFAGSRRAAVKVSSSTTVPRRHRVRRLAGPAFPVTRRDRRFASDTSPLSYFFSKRDELG
jgi:hypothetical protein